ncbi:hypothetical protein RD792_006234 [Penstemon davidsonii]|uniref:E3 ubiquitin-protein ligase RMA n=1 Tax=Penstemon davidsonii TaxID=160366 RepID=A0ABR0DCE6_9LAMI|nr:hypothetical protein RD792_006234 [Penstemon davidsonii]
MEQYRNLNEDASSLEKSKSLTSAFNESKTNSSSGFECNICLDLVQDPVVTFCGHLYCWPCIYRWINFQDNQKPQCPVCKAAVSHTTLIPLYGRGQNPSKDKAASVLGLVIPQRPPGPKCGVNSFIRNTSNNRSYARANRMLGLGNNASLVNSMMGMFGEMVYARFFGNSETTLYTYPISDSSSSPRIRRHLMQSDKSLSRICFFLCCCAMLCLLLF